MTKQELAHIAKIMYDLQEYCKSEGCSKCVSRTDDEDCDLFRKFRDGRKAIRYPLVWNITKTDIERLEYGEDGEYL